LCGAVLLLSSCSHRQEGTGAEDPTTQDRSTSPSVRYEFSSLDERPVSSEALQGRATVLVFLTTFGGNNDSIVQARFARKVYREHVPRINAAAVFMEPMNNLPLVRIYRDSVGLPFPIAMADTDTIAGKGPFRGVDAVPSAVVLDNQGREVWRKIGIATPAELRTALRKAQRNY
jgi:hypothetical protein